MNDLWPDDITTNTILKAPVTILKEQGVLLGRKTSNLVEGEVIKAFSDSEDHFYYTFYLVGPALGYRYRLLVVSHSINMYPLDIIMDGKDVLGELPAEMKGEHNKLVADSEEKFMEILKAIFATRKVRRVIEAIIAQSGVEIEIETE